MLTLKPIEILKPEAEEEKLESARLSNFAGSIAIGDLLKSTLGPKGMDKILLSSGMDHHKSGEIQITNDGATILKSLGIDNPAAKVLVEIAKTQDNEVGDGTTSVCVLASELLKEAEHLIEKKIHPQQIIAGWRKATDCARKALDNCILKASKERKFLEQELLYVAKTTLSSKNLAPNGEYFARLAANAVHRLKGKTDLSSIQIIKKLGGNLLDSFLDDGFILDKKIGLNQPKQVKNARILVANTSMDADKVKVFGSKVKVDSTAKIAEMELAEKEKMKEKVSSILKHDINVFINRQLIYNYPEQLFSDAGVMAIEHADFEGVERLASVLGAEIVSTFSTPSSVKLGHCDLIEEIMIGEDKMIKFSGVQSGQACSVVLRGATQHILDEAERSLHDALCVLSQMASNPRFICGGGCCETVMALAISNLANETPGKESVAMEAFARALLQIPTVITDNAGFDSSELITNLRAALKSDIENGKIATMGVDLNEGKVADMKQLGVLESYKVKLQMLESASEAAEMILRVDSIIKQAPRKREPDNRMC